MDALRARYLESEMDQLTRKTIELRRHFMGKDANILPTSFGNAVPRPSKPIPMTSTERTRSLSGRIWPR